MFNNFNFKIMKEHSAFLDTIDVIELRIYNAIIWLIPVVQNELSFNNEILTILKYNGNGVTGHNIKTDFISSLNSEKIAKLWINKSTGYDEKNIIYIKNIKFNEMDNKTQEAFKTWDDSWFKNRSILKGFTKKYIKIMKTLDEICQQYGGVKENNNYKIETKVGTLFVRDREDNTFIPMQFDDNIDINLFFKITNDRSINSWSYKWNLHSLDGEFNLERLENRLKLLAL